MGRTTIEVNEETRDRLRRFKSIDGLTYDAAIDELLAAYPWTDPVAPAEPPESGEGVPAECSNCGHRWDYTGDRQPGQNVTCPACSRKTELQPGA